MSTGLYCQRHQEYNHSGVCRWCEPPAEVPGVFKINGGVPLTSVPIIITRPADLTCGHYGFSRAELKGNSSAPFSRCACGLYSTTLDNCRWMDAAGVRHSPSDCA